MGRKTAEDECEPNACGAKQRWQRLAPDSGWSGRRKRELSRRGCPGAERRTAGNGRDCGAKSGGGPEK
jgi:hypothetical protein